MKIAVLGIRGILNVQGGAEKHTEELYKRIARCEHGIIIYARSSYFHKRRRVGKWGRVDIKYLACPHSQHLETISHTFIACVHALLKNQDIFHFHNIGPALFIPLVRIFGKKTVLTYHSMNYEHSKWKGLARFILRFGEFVGLKYSNRIIVVSRNILDQLQSRYHRDDLVYIPNGIERARKVPPGATLRKLGLSPRKYVFSACRLVPEKGVQDLLSAYRMLYHPAFKLVIAGKADHKTKYSDQLIAEAQQTEGVILTGFITGRPLEELYSNAGLFALASHSEGFPLCILEAIGYGVPVLVSDVPSLRELPLSKDNFFPVGNIGELAGKMRKFMTSCSGNAMAARIKEEVMREYNWENIARQTLVVLNSL